VGLGNPGAKYSGNRHNIGFMAVDRLAADHGFAPWRKAFQGMAADGRLGDERVVLLKPGTCGNWLSRVVQTASKSASRPGLTLKRLIVRYRGVTGAVLCMTGSVARHGSPVKLAGCGRGRGALPHSRRPSDGRRE
jgi:hypothetical protein